jgi:hypothetical protein
MTLADMIILVFAVLLSIFILLRSKLARTILVETFSHPFRKALIQVEPGTGAITVSAASDNPDSVNKQHVVA